MKMDKNRDVGKVMNFLRKLWKKVYCPEGHFCDIGGQRESWLQRIRRKRKNRSAR